jgi:hypothetical protein
MNEPRTRRSVWMRRLIAVWASLALVLLGGSAALAYHAWDPYHWEGPAGTANVVIASNLDAEWTGGGGRPDYFGNAIGDWNQSVLALTTTGGAGKKNCGAVEGRVEVCNDTYGNRQGGWLGVATIWADGDHLVKATVQLNDTFLFGGGAYDSDAWRRMVMCHEIGHTFGLDHRNEDFNDANVGSCLDYTLDPDGPPSNLKPDSHDIGILNDIYSHGDAATVGGGDDGGGGNCPARNPKCAGAVAKAPPFSQASPAKGDVYVDQMRNGLTRIKHVFWVPRR